MKNIVLTAILLMASVLTTSAQAGIIFYTDQADWEANVAQYHTENFDSAVLANGLAISSSASEFDIGAGRMYDRLTASMQDTLIEFNSNVNAFGGLWDLSPGGAGLGLQITLSSGEVLTQEIPDSFAGQFWGFISDESFTSISLASGTQGGIAETYQVNAMFYGTAIPEPASIALFGLGLLAFGARRKA
ncbi:PEP-CTERM sorting domain-containing protein [Thalassotalea euphylliae]|uniref:PEP-CTERM sorting domain-containing protein n=1 Tax=Thalassotalea euphylliae TaxID=1655234 RepID=UPI0036425879